MRLSIAAYDEAQRAALAFAGYTHLNIISTKTFQDHSFPTRMTEPSHLVRYFDWFRGITLDRFEPGRFFRDTPIETNYSLDEVQLLSKVANGVGALSRKLCGRRFTPHINHLGLLGMARVVEAIATLEAKRPLSVFEIGPGCGYVGTFLGLLGHAYGAHDVTQGYYLWQSWLHEHFFAEDFTEFAAPGTHDVDRPGRIYHLPWWVYLQLYKRCPIRADVVIANTNLGEMHPVALGYFLRIARLMLAESEIGLLLFAGVGAQHLSSFDAVMDELGRTGYRQVMQRNVFGYVLEDRTGPKRSIAVLEDQIPIYAPSGIGKTFGPRDFVSFDGDDLPEEYYLNAFVSDWPEVSSK